MLLLTVFVAFEIIIFFIGVNTNPITMVIIPLAGIMLWWLINNPAISLILSSLIAIAKGYLVNYFPVLEVIDITVIIIFIIWLGLTKMVLEGRWQLSDEQKYPVYLFLLFGLLLSLSFIYTPSPIYGLRKILRFNIFAITMFITPLLVIKSPNDSKRLLSYFKFFLIILTGIILIRFIYIITLGNILVVLAYWNRISIPEANPIQVSRYLAIGAGMVITLLIRNKTSHRLRYLLMLFGILLCIIVSGSRGPLVSIIIGVLAYAFLYEKKHLSKIYGYGILALCIITILLLFLPQNLTQRFFDVSQGAVIITEQGITKVNTIGTRIEFWIMSMDIWLSSIPKFFVGLGAGGFSSLSIWRDLRWYPHNLFFEIIAELGLIGLIIVILFLTKVYQAIKTGIQSGSFTEHSALWVAGTIVMFIAAQFSGDFNDNRVLWMLIGISMASTHVDKLHAMNMDELKVNKYQLSKY